MQAEIDPKIDYAFHRIFGNEDHPNILVGVLNDVLRLKGDGRVASVKFRNPIVRSDNLDGKLPVLDIRAVDQLGRQFNVEMQMLLHAGFANRILYYGTCVHSDQLDGGEDYTRLMPTISVCFLDAVLFRERSECYLEFRMREKRKKLTFCDDFQIHLFQLPRFTKQLHELKTKRDAWLYLLRHGAPREPNNLPRAMRQPPFQEDIRSHRHVDQRRT